MSRYELPEVKEAAKAKGLGPDWMSGKKTKIRCACIAWQELHGHKTQRSSDMNIWIDADGQLRNSCRVHGGEIPDLAARLGLNGQQVAPEPDADAIIIDPAVVTVNDDTLPPGEPQPELSVIAGNIPAPLRDLPQWVCWRLEPRKEGGKPTKIPMQSPVSMAKVNDPATWLSFDNALNCYKDNPDKLSGVGFVFTDGLVGIDLDHCIDTATGELAPWAVEIVSLLPTYCELSPSGTGLHLIALGQKPAGGSRKGNVEIYDTGRYFTFTGKPFGELRDVIDCTEALNTVHAKFIASVESTKDKHSGGVSSSRKLDLSDDRDLIDKACNAKNGSKFSALWNGDAGDDHSAADAALCAELAFWCGKDAARMDRLFRQSGLMRPKWDEVHSTDGRTYGEMTLDKAIAGVSNVYEGFGKGSAERASQKPSQRPVEGVTDVGHKASDEELASKAHTDMGLSERLVARHGDSLRYCGDFGRWLVWDSRRWCIDKAGDAMLKAKDTTRLILREASTIHNSDRSKELVKFALKSQARERLSAMLALSQCELPILPDNLDQYPMLLNVKNGIVDLISGDIIPHNRQYLITKLANVEYDPLAQCPLWLSFINRIFDEDLELIAFIQKALGYSMTGKINEQCFFVCYGTGRNGKSTLLETIANLLSRDYAQQAAPELLMAKKNDRHPTEVADLRGARFVSAVETKQGGRLNEPLLKQMSGGDRMKARFLNQDFFEFLPQFKLWLATNHRPVIKGTDLGIWRRIRLIPFNVQIPEDEVDSELGEKLKAEYPGILNWLIAGVLMWQSEGLTPPEAVKAATDDYRVEQDILTDWLGGLVVDRENPRCREGASALYTNYKTWCEQSGEHPLTQREWGMRLTERGFSRGKANSVCFWKGLRLPE